MNFRKDWPKTMSVVEVVWVDSNVLAGWRGADVWDKELTEGSMLCRTAGYLYRSDRQRVVVFQSVSAGGSLTDCMEIPRSAVRSVTVLRKRGRKWED